MKTLTRAGLVLTLLAMSLQASAATFYVPSNIFYNKNAGEEAFHTLSLTTETDSEITAANDMTVILPDTAGVLFKTDNPTLSFSGTASTKVATGVTYSEDGRRLTIDVTEDFAAGDVLDISGIVLRVYHLLHDATHPVLDIDGDGVGDITNIAGIGITDTTIELDSMAPYPVRNASIEVSDDYNKVTWDLPIDLDLVRVEVTRVDTGDVLDLFLQTEFFDEEKSSEYIITVTDGLNKSPEVSLLTADFVEAPAEDPVEDPVADPIQPVEVVPADPVATVDISEVADSGLSGTVEFFETGGDLEVVVSLSGYNAVVEQPSHIHTGTCDELLGIKYELTDTINGDSTTTIADKTFEEIKDEGPLAINIHKSEGEIDVSQACGNLPMNVPVEVFPAYLLNPFADTEGHWAEDYIAQLYSLDIVNGKTDDAFWPDAPITRAEFLKVIMEAFDIAQNGNTGGFNDISGHWAEGYIEGAKARGLIGGFEDGSFKPNFSITRAAAMKILLEATEYDTRDVSAGFDDVSSSDWFAPYVNYAYANNIVSGYEDNTFRPENNMTRAEVAKVVALML